jgi:hypothetical protein
MNKIEKADIEAGIKIAISSMEKKGIHSKIQIENVPENDIKKEGEFDQIVSMRGEIEYGKLKEKLIFSLSVPVPSHHDEKNWAWLVVYHFLGKVFCLLLEKEGLKNDVRSLHKLQIDLVDELIKAT